VRAGRALPFYSAAGDQYAPGGAPARERVSPAAWRGNAAGARSARQQPVCLGKRLVDTAARQPALFDEHKNELRAVRVELIETLLATLGAAEALELTRSERTRQAHSVIVKTAEDYACRGSESRFM